ncbi:MAG: glycosyltransferase [bacterium]
MNCYNSSKYLEEAINSVYAQTYKDWEIVFLDNASTDNSADIAKSYNSKLKYYKNETNVPLGCARNMAIEKANGEYIAFLDCDDMWSPEKLELQVGLLDKNPNIGLVYCDAFLINEDNTKIINQFFKIAKPFRGEVTIPLINWNFIPCLTVMFKKGLFTQAGPFRTDLNISEEYELFLRLSLITEFDYINNPLAKYRCHIGSVSKDTKRRYEEINDILSSFSEKITDLSIKKVIAANLSKNKKVLMVIKLLDYIPKPIGGFIKSFLKGMNKLLKAF